VPAESLTVAATQMVLPAFVRALNAPWYRWQNCCRPSGRYWSEPSGYRRRLCRGLRRARAPASAASAGQPITVNPRMARHRIRIVPTHSADGTPLARRCDGRIPPAATHCDQEIGRILKLLHLGRCHPEHDLRVGALGVDQLKHRGLAGRITDALQGQRSPAMRSAWRNAATRFSSCSRPASYPPPDQMR